MVCPPVRGDNPRALARGLSPVQADKPWYYYFYITLKSVDLGCMKYFMLKFAISGKSGIYKFQLCTGFGFGFGAAVGKRDVSLECCDTDLCNFPTSTTVATTPTTSLTTIHYIHGSYRFFPFLSFCLSVSQYPSFTYTMLSCLSVSLSRTFHLNIYQM